jgi:hypothetical protein
MTDEIHRRSFLGATGLAGAAAMAGPFAQAAPAKTVALLLNDDDPLVQSQPVRRALRVLEEALTKSGYVVRRFQRDADAPNDAQWIRIGGLEHSTIDIDGEQVDFAALPEAMELGSGVFESAVDAKGSDPRGLSYALYELAERANAGKPLRDGRDVLQSSFAPVRSVMRQFVSEQYDKPWFTDREMWPRYLAMLAAARFNRLHLAFGLGYDMLKNVEDSYFLFLYPFLMAVPGYDVRVTNLSDAERDKNLDTLQYIAKETVAHGLDFELGIWMHGYQWIDSPKARYVIEGLTPETHAPYCREALRALLAAIPEVSSVGLRIHGESGVAEGSYDFWKEVFAGAAGAGRAIELDLHAKGIDETMIANALATGLPVNVSPKYSAEHLGLAYPQAAIRELEMPKPGEVGRGLMTLSEGQRSFTRYGYADLLREDRKYTVRHRVFAGTQKLLASGDAKWAGAYARAFSFCGSTGADLMEPLTCRGRRGSASSSPRSGYADARLEARYDWQKYADWYRCFGRALYDPEYSVHESPLGAALAAASRILPLVTNAYLPSAACDVYWPEIYWNQPLAATAPAHSYDDTPSPKFFHYASPLDPQLFSTMDEFTGELLSGQCSGKYSPIETASWLEDFSVEALAHLRQARQRSVGDMRLVIDIEIQASLARFFAAKFRAGVLYALFERTGNWPAIRDCVAQYYVALGHWNSIVTRARGVYAGDLSVSDRFSERGAWKDRLNGINFDIAMLEQKLYAAKRDSDPRVTALVAEVLAKAKRAPIAATHTPPSTFQAGQAVALEFAPPESLASVRLYYRRVNQAERWQSAEMTAQAGVWRAAIAADYAASPYPLQYYFEPRAAADKAWLYPGLGADLTGMPYYVVRRA